MPAKYPAVIPTVTDYPDRTDDVDWVLAARYNEIKAEMIAICAELGIDPRGASATVKARLDALSAKVLYSKSIILSNPTADTSGPVWRAQAGLTIKAIHVLCMDGTNITGQLWEYDANGANGSAVDSADIVGTAGSNVNDDGTLSNPGIASGNYVGWKMTSVAGAVTRAIITFDYELT